MALASVLKPQFISANQYNPCLLQEEYVGELSDLRQQLLIGQLHQAKNLFESS